MTPYRELEKHFKRISLLEEAIGVLDWDTAAMMPKGGASARAEQIAALRLMRHEALTAAVLSDLLDGAEEAAGLDGWKAANLREMRQEWRHAIALRRDLVEALSKASSACEMEWRGARAGDDFAAVAPALERVLGLVREVAAAKAEAFGCDAYDALLDAYEPGGRAAEIEVLFAELEAFLADFLGRVVERQRSLPAIRPLVGPFPVESQRRLGLKLMEVLGFDFDHGRLDVSPHPFCGGTSEDVRVTTRYDEDDFSRSLMAVLHETGHALYKRGLPAAWRHQPVGRARGTSLHESQSLIIEMQACRSREFIEFAAPLMREAFAGAGPAWEADNLHRLFTRVEAGAIRVDADEVTYSLHVILRTRLEKAMIAGDLKVCGLPGAWKEGMRSLLGYTPRNDREGCLQDIHWFDGTFAYFPTYTLGAMSAAQLFEEACRADTNILPGIALGDFRPLLRWLGANVHEKASSLETRELLVKATGKPLDAAALARHLERRYLSGA